MKSKNIESTSHAHEPQLVETGAKNGATQSQKQWTWEALGIAILISMVVYFLGISWRKWTDPLIDGYVWYNAWQLSLGALLYHDVPLSYGPLTAFLHAGLFRLFGPGMMILVVANLVVYGLILTLAYITLRIAWGRFGAFIACAVFVSVFSFSQLQQSGNFNFAAPYAHEIPHGMLLILIATIVAARWCRERSLPLAFFLGLCGGLATVLKPEFMLATGFLIGSVLILRWLQKQPVTSKEIAVAAFGLMIPTLIFAAWFARTRSWGDSFIDASQAWWQVLFSQRHRGSVMQQNASGINDPLNNALAELAATATAIIVIGCIWAMGWALNRSWSRAKYSGAFAVAGAVIFLASRTNQWFDVGLCLPGLIGVLFLFVANRLRCQWCTQSPIERSSAMALMLIVTAGGMLARMLFFARVYDFGFYQAAFAAMVVAAAIVTWVPDWTGARLAGRRLTRAGCVLLLATACISLAADSQRVRSAQTQVVGSGQDRIYSFNPKFDATGALVDWVVQSMESVDPKATLMVLPEGALINYLSRHKYPTSDWMPVDGGKTEEESKQMIDRLSQSPPDYVVLISRSMSEHGLTRFGAPGTPGAKTLEWIQNNYRTVAANGGNPLSPQEKGAVILQRNHSAGD